MRKLSKICLIFFFFSSRRRHTRCSRDWSSDVCSSDLFSAYYNEALGSTCQVTAYDRLKGRAGDVPDPIVGAKSPKGDRKSTRLNSSHGYISYAVFCLKKKKKQDDDSIKQRYTYTTA